MNLDNSAINMLEHGEEIICVHCSEKIPIQGKSPFSSDNCSHCGFAYEVPLYIQQFRLDSIVKDDGVFVEYKAFDSLLNRNVLLKKLNKEFHPQDSEPAFPFIDCLGAVNIFSTFTHENELFFIFEALKGYSIKSYLRRKERIDLKRAVHLAINVCKIMSNVASTGVSHGNLVPEAIWVNEEGEVLIKDFMLYQNVLSKNDSSKRISEILDVRYCSSKMLQSLEVDERSDLYSFGIFLYRILSETFPYNIKDMDEVLKKQSLHELDLSPLGETDSAIKRLITGLLKEEEEFSTFSKVLEYLQVNFITKKSKSSSSKSSKKSRESLLKASPVKNRLKTQVKLPVKGKIAVKESKRTLKKLFR